MLSTVVTGVSDASPPSGHMRSDDPFAVGTRETLRGAGYLSLKTRLLITGWKGSRDRASGSLGGDPHPIEYPRASESV